MSEANNVVGWFELYVADMTRAKRFYQAVFQREMSDLPAMGPDMQMCAFAWVEKGAGASGALVKTSKMGPGGGGTLVYFSCADCAVEAARAQASGGILCQPKMGIGEYGFIAIVQDTEGNTIGLYRKTLFAPPWCDIAHGNPQGVKAALAPLLRAAMAHGQVSAELYSGAWTDVGTVQRLQQLNAAA